MAVKDARFLIYEQFAESAKAPYANLKTRLHRLPSQLFPSQNFPDRLAAALAKQRAIHVKELLEAFEFYARVRKRLRRPVMADLCAGHGLVGMIFGLCERSVERVILLDEKIPASFERVRRACEDVGPWLRDKVEYRTMPLTAAGDALPDDCGICIVHGCGSLTDQGIDLAVATKSQIAAMPCCYGKARSARVPGLSSELGRATTIDVSRSYRLAEAGYQVDWSAIPLAVTPRNRIVLGWNRRPTDSRD